MTTKVTESGESYSLNPEIISGTYLKQGANLIHFNLNIQLVVGARKKPTFKKPKYYLLLRLGKSFKYLTSLYPVKGYPGRYTLDYNGKPYVLTSLPDRVTIQEPSSLGNGYNNNSHLGH